MNKQEAQEQLTKVQAEVARLQEIIEAPEGRWRAKRGGEYWVAGSIGDIMSCREDCNNVDNKFYENGNYFQTEEQAKKSNIYKMLNSTYEYYFAGDTDNFDDIPREFEYLHAVGWVLRSINSSRPCNPRANYRWKRK